MSKIYEKLLLSKILRHCEENVIIPPEQNGFSPATTILTSPTKQPGYCVHFLGLGMSMDFPRSWWKS